MMKRAILIVMDGVGIGALPDADQFGDAGANTLVHVAKANDGLDLPNLNKLGLGAIDSDEDPILGVNRLESCHGYFGKMIESGGGKDSTAGHWELCGLILDEPFRTFPNGFARELIDRFCEEAELPGCLGNKVASGTGIIDELGEEHMSTGKPIVYTSADSVFQIAAHEDVVDVARLYKLCEIAFDLTQPLNIGRVIARPFIGKPGQFERTPRRKDFSVEPPTDTLLDHLLMAGIAVYGVGKVDNLFAMRGFSNCVHTKHNMHGVDEILRKMQENKDSSLIFANLVDFDTQYGHRNDATGFGRALVEFDRRLPEIFSRLTNDDLLIITADHGNDPTHPGTDHTREHVPVLVTNRGLLQSSRKTKDMQLGLRQTFADVGSTIAEFFDVHRMSAGTSFYSKISN